MAASRSTRRVVIALVGILALGTSAIGLGQRSPVEEPLSAISASATDGQPVAFDLYTHCGVSELKFDGKYYQHVGKPVDNGFGNLPAGWRDPYQHGALSVSGDIATFRDKVGHVENFKLRPGATGFLTICS